MTLFLAMVATHLAFTSILLGKVGVGDPHEQVTTFLKVVLEMALTQARFWRSLVRYAVLASVGSVV